jgi:hypothetical protein
MSPPPAKIDPNATPGVLQVRGVAVMLDSDIALSFGVETGHVNQAVARNPAKFSTEHGFQLTDAEFAALKSQSVISNVGRGGRRYPPHVFTIKGVARLATVLNSDAALRATDLIIDTFIEVQRQLAKGVTEVKVSQPSRLQPHGPDLVATGIRKKLAKAVDALLDTVIDVKRDMNVRAVGQEMTSEALENLRQRLKTKGLENAHLEAEIAKAMAEAERIYAEARKTHAEAQGVELDNIPKRIAAVRELKKLYDESEPSALVQILTTMQQANPLMLEGPENSEDQD